jgi:hypothetical protein
MASPAEPGLRSKRKPPMHAEPQAPPATIPFPPPSRSPAISRPKIIDEFGALSQEIDKLRLLERRHEQLRRMILTWHSDARPTEAVDEEGKTYSVHISPCAEQRMIGDMEAVANRLGYKTFFQNCTFSLEKLDGLILPKDQAAFVRRESIGPRIVKAIPKHQEPVS